MKNNEGELPLHLACKHERNSELVKYFLSIRIYHQFQLITKNDIFGNTPLHVAAFLGNEVIVDTIMNNCDKRLINELLELPNKLGDTPVHAAAAKNHLSILEKMYFFEEHVPQENLEHVQQENLEHVQQENLEHVQQENLEPMTRRREFILTLEGRFQGLPIHSACGYGRIETVKKLVEWGKFHEISPYLERESVMPKLPAFTKTTELKIMKKEQKDEYNTRIKSLSSEEGKSNIKSKHYTPLTRACHFGHKEVVKILLKEGAIQHPLALIKAIDGLYHECVELLVLEKQFATENLKYSCLTTSDSFSVPTTPFRELIKHMPDIAELVLDLKYVKLEKFLVNSENFKIELNYELIGSDERWDLEKLKEENYTHSILSASSKASYVHVNSKETHPLSLMVKHKREQLLTHPVVASLIHDKWKSIYGLINIGHWVLYLMYMIFTHKLMFALPHPNGDYCTQDEKGSSGMCSLDSENTDCNDTLNNTVSDSQYIGYATVMMIYSFVRLGFELFQVLFVLIRGTVLFYKSRVIFPTIVITLKQADYIWDLSYLIELPLFILSIIFSIFVLTMKNEGFCLLNWQWLMGAAILWLSWIELIFLSTQFQFIGVHALMFKKILKTLVKFIPLAVFLIIGFGLAFHFLLVQPHLMGSPYSSVHYSLLKTLALTLDNLDTDNVFGFDIRGQAHVQNLGLVTCYWVLSLIFMTVLLSNLTIGLAVGDIQAITKKAVLEKLSLQVNYLLSIENSKLTQLYYQKIKPQIKKFKCCKQGGEEQSEQRKEFEPNKFERNIVKWFVYRIFWGGVCYDSQESITRLISAKVNVEKKHSERRIKPATTACVIIL